MLPEVDTAKEFWLPTPEQSAELEGLAARPRAAKETEFYLPWRQEQLQENARRKAQNEITKTRIDLETKVLQERQDTIGKLMGDVLEDLTKASLDKIEKYVKPEVAGPAAAVAEGGLAPEPPEQVRTLEEARQRGDWLFIFEAARATHLDAGAEDVESHPDGTLTVIVDPEGFETIRARLAEDGFTPETTEMTQLASTRVPVTGEEGWLVLKLLGALEELDDVQNLYSNADVSDEIARQFQDAP